jgi:hypothetical protein
MRLADGYTVYLYKYMYAEPCCHLTSNQSVILSQAYFADRILRVQRLKDTFLFLRVYTSHSTAISKLIYYISHLQTLAPSRGQTADCAIHGIIDRYRYQGCLVALHLQSLIATNCSQLSYLFQRKAFNANRSTKHLPSRKATPWVLPPN